MPFRLETGVEHKHESAFNFSVTKHAQRQRVQLFLLIEVTPIILRLHLHITKQKNSQAIKLPVPG